MEHQVKNGDTLGLIASANNTTVATLMRLNPQIEHADRIYPGQNIALPGKESQQRQTRTVGQVADNSQCSDEYVDLLHQADERLFIPLTAAMQRDLEQEEAKLEQLITQFYAGLQGTQEQIRAFKASFIELLEKERIIDEAEPSEPMRLTEIRRLKGKKHYAYIRRDSFWKPFKKHRSYSIESQDQARSKGWFDPSSGKVNPGRLLDAIKDDLKQPKLSLKIAEDFTDWCLREWKSDPISWQPAQGMQPIEANAQAQALRFAVGASLSAGYSPFERSANIEGKINISASLLEGKATASTTWPADEASEWKIKYLDANGQEAESSLGKFRCKVELEAKGFAGASAVLAADIQVDMKDGVPRLKGVGGQKYMKADEGPAKAEASAFVGVRADGKLEGSVEWQDTLASQSPEWKALCTLGVGAGAALGLGAEARLLLKWSPITGKFYFNVHAGLVVGAGASGEFGAEVDAREFASMLHCIYNALLEVDFRHVKSIDPLAFEQLCNLAVYSLIFGSPMKTTAIILGTKAASEIVNIIDGIYDTNKALYEREKLAIETAKNILKDAQQTQSSWLRHAPPEVKGKLLDLVCNDYFLTPFDYYTAGANSRESAVLTILESSQSWRDYEEAITRMNPKGKKSDFSSNRLRLLEFMRTYQGFRLEAIEARLRPTKPVADQPVVIGRHVSLSGIQYA
ncbi:LysM peptidoglycan-binding domain-containing protein [Pseudomonas sp. TTU2014-080ASC]|uniref:LysM peptidoglycan-binding domain-containing protein n=1 Tax=Pseudomonas sp. TTU2014-080ASC TaxID=1729724 RepID=UPI000718A817|nr:LysM domain-containing protein [Pseudomonas sp. TTU2014-080ASC]KRW61209.1 hypothetical protein AO726_07705 [Pseudomonas sp. TTU2014-080ASC]